MTKTKSNAQCHSTHNKHSEDYTRIKSQAEKSWPSWKVNAYNNYASSRSKKIVTSK